MAKLYFKYGAMGSSKTAQALITKYNYEENDLKVWLIKPSADTRDGAEILRSRIGLEAQVEVIPPDVDIYARCILLRHFHDAEVCNDERIHTRIFCLFKELGHVRKLVISRKGVTNIMYFYALFVTHFDSFF